ncbi:PepSY domain-containing protein [Ochrobactrum teleogrylli]|uniref:PepSY domain-containing protein n=1 Tax=Ochrobactrum teleogrylli TaxID=2479765 RepID=A0ABY2Y953_9HYPH|nr:PepSY domain-containing protein [[Ochrobactrum] teleogrylli]TNV18470.1 PepSY domain-containing protein [[Ochrobactrum] teleogrylli]
MRLMLTVLAFAATCGLASAAAPEGQKLSEIISKIEQTSDVSYVDEVDWNDRGYYEIEYFMKNGAKVEIKIDPKTGESIK